MNLAEKIELIHEILDKVSGPKKVVVAFSGGVDSSLLLKIAFDKLGDGLLALTVDSPTFPRVELEEAKKIAFLIGAKHLVLQIDELNNPAFASNPPDRCYHCKKMRYARLRSLIESQDIENASFSRVKMQIIDGTNADDLLDWRPGIKAALELGVRSPFAEAGLSKEEIRVLARAYCLPNHDKPALSCLASRIPYGEPITIEKLQQVARAEQYLRSLGFSQLRVRHHGAVARIEVPKESIEAAAALSDEISAEFKVIGFNYAALDLSGFKSGNMNAMLK